MTSLWDVHQKQRAVIEFFVFEEEPPINIFKRLEKEYGNAAVSYSAIKKWVSRIKSEEEDPSTSDLQDKQGKGKPSSAVVPKNSAMAEKLITEHRRVNIDEIAVRLGISHGSTAKIVGELRLAKFSAKWVSKQL